MTATATDARAPGAEIDLHRPAAQPSPMATKIAYARALAESGLLPAAYRKNPANILWAMEYGEMLGLAPMATMIGVHVIDGKPTASAGLISGLVRQAGHKLRVWGDGNSATCEIIRSDEPKHVFSVTWTLKKTGPNPSAEQAKLLSKDVWQKYPAAMLKSRAITQCARDACDEVLFGLHYTPEELGAEVDEDGDVVDEAGYDEQEHPADRSAGTPGDDPWYVRPAPPQQDQPDAPAGDTRRWADTALAQAASFKTEAEGDKLWREAGARHRAGDCTRDEADHIQSLVTARISDRRKEAATRILKPVPDDDPWREVITELADDETARDRLTEVQQLLGSGQMDEDRAKLLGRAIIAMRPKAVLKAGDDDG